MRSRSGFAAVMLVGFACGGDDEPRGGGANVVDAGFSCLERDEIALDFELEGLAELEFEVDLACVTSERDPGGANRIIDFTGCTDPSGTAHGDLALTLIGDWPWHYLGTARPTRLRYVQRATGQRIDRWLFTETDGQFPVPLVIVDATTLTPSDDSLTIGPVTLSVEWAPCENLAFADGCGPRERLAVRARYDGGEWTGLDGTRSTLTGGPPDFLNSTQYDLIIPYAAVLAETFCQDVPSRRVVVALVAFPFS